MERVFSEEEKIRRAIEISERRNNASYRRESARVNVNTKKDYKLFKKMILQIVICLLIYIIFYLISSTNYIFSDEVIKNTNQILSYDINFKELYNNFILFINQKDIQNQDIEENHINLQNSNTVNITQTNNENNSVQNDVESNIISNSTNNIKKEIDDKEKKKEEETKTEEVSKTKTQMELDAEKAKKSCKFTKPLSGTITSEFGEREVVLNGMTSDHKGIDIAANSGTNIKAAIAGKVSVAEENSEYGKFIKIVNGDVMTVYAHCQKLKVKVGDKVKLRTNDSNCGFDRKINRSTLAFWN